MNNPYIYLIFFLITAVIYNQSFKIGLNKSQKISCYMALISMLSGVSSLMFIPLYKIKFSFENIALIIIICFLYAIVDSLNVIVRKELDVSIFSILRQISNVFLVIIGFIFFKEKFVIKKFIGALLIILSNFLVLYHKSDKKNNSKILAIGIIANLLFCLTLFLNINVSLNYNVALYVSIILFFPGIIMCFLDRIKPKTLFEEFKNSRKFTIIITCISGALMLICQLKAYEYGKVTIIAPLCSLTVTLNVIFGYFILNEKSSLIKKILASIIIIIGIILIKNA